MIIAETFSKTVMAGPSSFTRRREKNEAIEWAQTLVGMKERWVILDIETTDFNSAAAIIQIGVIDPRGQPLIDNIRIKLVTPRSQRIGNDIHQLTVEMARELPTFSHVYPLLEPILINNHVVMFDAEYGVSLIHREAKRYRLLHLPKRKCVVRHTEICYVPR